MMILKKYLHTFLFLLFLGGTSIPLMADNAGIYQEKVYLQLGRTYLNAGEALRYTAHTASNLQPATKVLSKVLYVQLINNKQTSVLEQVLEINGNLAGAVLNIPDTLSTGLYELKAYTNWMKNFGESSFFSEPVYIYNQYDSEDKKPAAILNENLAPELYISGAELVAGISAKVIVRVPEFYAAMPGAIIEQQSGNIAATFKLHAGCALSSFTPMKGGKYAVQLGDSLAGFRYFELAETKPAGYGLKVIAYKNNQLSLMLYKQNVEQLDLQLEVSGTENKVNVPVKAFQDSVSIIVPITANLKGVLQLSLKESGRKELASKMLVLTDLGPHFDENAAFATRDKIQIPIKEVAGNINNLSGISVNVYKTPPYKLKANYQAVQSLNSYAWVPLSNTVKELLPRLNKKQLISYTAKADYQYPVEDLGITYTGTLYNSETQKPQPDIDVVLAMKDSAVQVIAGQTNERGEFSLLINRKNTTGGEISLYKNGKRFNGNVRLKIDPKFYYTNKSSDLSETKIVLNAEFRDEIEEEAQRILIQRAFGHSISSEPSLMDTTGKYIFYGEPELVVRPSEFFFLPNFEEIAREIMPRVRFKEDNNVCELMVIDVDNHLTSNIPLALLNGIPVQNYCDLFRLNSDDIDRIDVQSGNRVSGNLMYDGLVAVYTTEAYFRNKKNQQNQATYPIPGYSNVADNYEWHINTDNLSNSSIPDFENELYWRISLTNDSAEAGEFEFYTSDEEGMYTLDIMGINTQGLPVHIQRNFKVKAKLTAQQ